MCLVLAIYISLQIQQLGKCNVITWLVPVQYRHRSVSRTRCVFGLRKGSIWWIWARCSDRCGPDVSQCVFDIWGIFITVVCQTANSHWLFTKSGGWMGEWLSFLMCQLTQCKCERDWIMSGRFITMVSIPFPLMCYIVYYIIIILYSFLCM